MAPITGAFLARFGISVLISSLIFSDTLGPDQVRLFDQISRTSDEQWARASGQGSGEETFDYVIIGGGSAGAVVANRLSASGLFTVLLLEAGGDPNPVSDIPLARKHISAAGELRWPYTTVEQTNACLNNGGLCSTPRAKVLGGCSILNGALYNRCQRKDYELWANFTGDQAWSPENVLEAYKRIESYHGFFEGVTDNNRGSNGEVYVGTMDYIPGAELILQAFAVQGLPTVDLNALKDAYGFTKIDYNIKDGLRQGSYHAFIEPALDRPNLKVYRYALASQIHFDGTKRATGVTYSRHTATREVHATREIIVSAGAYESPKILMLSGIGPAAHLAEKGIPLIVNNSAVGNYLQDHVATGGLSHPFVINQIYGKPDFYSDEALVEYVTMGTGPLNAFEFGSTYAPQLGMGYFPSRLFDDKTWPDIQIYVHERVVFNNFVPEQQIYIDHALLRPKSYGTVRLASNNINDQPLIDFRFFDTNYDLERLVDGIEISAELMLNSSILIEKGVKWSDLIVKVPACSSFTFPSRDYWRCFVKQTSATHFHPTSSCRMGSSPETAVVDSHLRVFGTTNLRVIDASVIPFVTSGNTNFPAMMVGEMGSNFIIQNTL